MSLLLAELRHCPEGNGRSLTRSAFLFLQEFSRFVGGAKAKDTASAGGGGSTEGGDEQCEEGDPAFWGGEAWLGRSPEKALLGVVGGIGLLTAASQPLPGACWVSFCAAQALLRAQFHRAASGSRGLPTSFPWHAGASSCSARAPEAVVRPMHAQRVSHGWQGLSPSPG